MNAPLLTEEFHLLAAAPNGVQKLRELILSLGVRGKLVAQDTKDEPASELLKRIKTEKAKLVAQGKIKLGKPLHEVSEDEKSFPVPNAWEWVRFDSIAITRLGKMLDGAKNRGDLKPYLRNTNVQWWKIYLDDIKSLRLDSKELDEYRLLPGDLLICEGGEPGRCAIWTDSNTEMYFQKALHRARPCSGIAAEYLQICLTADAASGSLDHLFTGATIKHFPGEKLSMYVIPLPPLVEQLRIVAKVDELMVLCDQLEAQQTTQTEAHERLVASLLDTLTQSADSAAFADNWSRIAEHFDLLFDTPQSIDKLKQCVLQLAVLGKLEPQDPSDEPVELSFTGLQAIKGIATDGPSIPPNWARCAYRSLTSLVTSGSRGWKEWYSDVGAIFIRTQNIKTDRLVLDDVAFVSLPDSAEGMRTQVQRDDILITITGANVTKAARIETELSAAYVSQHIALTRPHWSAMSRWLHLCFVSHGSARGTLERLAYGAKPGLNLNNIRDLELPIPPLAEQHRIVAKVDELMAVCDALAARLTAARELSAKLVAAVAEAAVI